MASIGTYNFPNPHVKGDKFLGGQYTLSLNGSVKDLTSATARCMFRRGSKTGKVVKSLTVGSGLTLTDASNGVITIDAFVMDFRPDTYFYDIEITDSAGVIKTFVEGTIVVMQDTSY